MSKEEVFFYTPTAQVGPGSNGRGSARVVEPDEIIQPPKLAFLDEADRHLAFHLKHEMAKTAGKQAQHFVQARRQKEVDSFRVEQAMEMYNDLAANAAEHMDRLCRFRDSCQYNIHPDAAARIERVVERGMDIQEKLPVAGTTLYLRRYAYG